MSYERNFGNVTFNAIQNPPNYGVVSLTSLVDTSSTSPCTRTMPVLWRHWNQSLAGS